MTYTWKNDGPSLDLSQLLSDDFKTLNIASGEDVEVFIPLPSINVTNDYGDICSDLIDSSWAAEKLSAYAEKTEVAHDYPEGTHRVRLKFLFTHTMLGFLEAVYEVVVLFRDLDETDIQEVARYTKTRDLVLEYEDELDTYKARVPDIIDWYFANLVGGAYYQMRYDAPDRYEQEMGRFPERRLNFYKSAFSSLIGADCYTSADSWMIPASVGLDHFFETTGQKYRSDGFVRGEVFTVDGQSFVMADTLIAYFPMAQYFKSRVCSSIALQDDDEAWPPDTFSWTDAAFTHSPFNEFGRLRLPEGLRANPPEREACLIDQTGSLIILNDGKFCHILYDTKALSAIGRKTLSDHVNRLAQGIGASIGIASLPALEWWRLSDEQFEQLCYDLIFVHPRFDADTIRKFGKSRSRDGGRDIQVHEIPRNSGSPPKKWIIQCKLISNGSSLTGAKLTNVSDMLEQYGAEGFGVMTSGPIDATLYDKMDAICSRRGIDQLHFSVLELERALARNPAVRNRYFKAVET